MGWSYGVDDDGREIGYGVEAVCDTPWCSEGIDRGLAYRCGGTRNLFDGEPGCGAYVCARHNFLDSCQVCDPDPLHDVWLELDMGAWWPGAERIGEVFATAARPISLHQAIAVAMAAEMLDGGPPPWPWSGDES